jgi:hypothetical protein
MQVYGINDLNTLSQSYKEKVNIIMVYISEAHATDEWPLSKKITIKQHQTIEERITAVKLMKEKFNCEFDIYTDSLEEDKSFEKVYSGWPERGYIVYKGKLEYVSYAEVNSRMLWFKEFQDWLQKNI